MRPVVLAFALAFVLAAALVPTGAAAGANWGVGVAAGSSGEARSQAAPSAPTGVTATCTAPTQTTVKVTWNAVTNATSYNVLQSTQNANNGFSTVATGVTATSWTSGALAASNYWYRVVAVVGANWASAQSSSTAKRTITTGACA